MHGLVAAVVVGFVVWLANAPTWGVVGLSLLGYFVGMKRGNELEMKEGLSRLTESIDEVTSTVSQLESKIDSIDWR